MKLKTGLKVQKAGMTGIYSEDGRLLPVTVLTAPAMVVTQVKSDEKDGYKALQFAFGTSKSIPKHESKKLKKLKLDITPKGYSEFPFLESHAEVGKELKIEDIFKVGDIVIATGISKGKGFAGVIKRHGFQRQPVTGGQSDRTRAPGSIGAQTPGKVLKGKRMPGHMGNKKVSTLGLKIVKIDSEKNQIYVQGSVPGHTNSWLTLSSSK